jgi:hypothetical protein
MLKARIPEGLEYELISGAAGEGFAAEFMGFLRIFESLPDLATILADPDNSPVPTEPSVLFAVVGALVARAERQNFTHPALWPSFTRKFQVCCYRCTPQAAVGPSPGVHALALEHQITDLGENMSIHIKA